MKIQRRIHYAHHDIEAYDTSGQAPAAHEVHHLQLVTFVKLRLAPLRAWNDIAIQFDGDAIAFQSQLLDEIRNRCRGDFFILTVNLYFHLRGQKQDS